MPDSQYIETNALPHSYTLQCLFHEKSNSLANDIIDYRWFVLVEFLISASNMMILIGIVEFYSALAYYNLLDENCMSRNQTQISVLDFGIAYKNNPSC